MQKFFDSVQFKTEAWLTKRKARKTYEKNHKTAKSEALDWLDAIAFAVVFVFLLNQFIFQLFVIPSPSMLETLQINDRVIVSKLSYGIELYPEGPKAFANRSPDRDEIITFYNPEYESRGSLFNILNQLIFRATFSLVNIDKDEDGNMREQLLVKRTAGVAGDTLRFENGNAKIKASGTGSFEDESVFRSVNNLATAPHRLIEKETYVGYNAQGRLEGLSEKGVSANQMPKHLVNKMGTINQNKTFTDYYGYTQKIWEGQRMADPSDMNARSEYTLLKSGVYVPDGCVLPLGDNRDNSTDGRYFGPIEYKHINGLVTSVFWPAKDARSLLYN